MFLFLKLMFYQISWGEKQDAKFSYKEKHIDNFSDISVILQDMEKIIC